MTIVREGEIVAFYIDNEVICAACAAGEERDRCSTEKGFPVEELEGAIDTLWCDRCGAGIFTFH